MADSKKEKTDWHRIVSGLFAHTFEEPSFDVKVDFDVATTEKMVDIVV